MAEAYSPQFWLGVLSMAATVIGAAFKISHSIRDESEKLKDKFTEENAKLIERMTALETRVTFLYTFPGAVIGAERHHNPGGHNVRDNGNC